MMLQCEFLEELFDLPLTVFFVDFNGKAVKS